MLTSSVEHVWAHEAPLPPTYHPPDFAVGAAVGATVGATVGAAVGAAVGAGVGTRSATDTGWVQKQSLVFVDEAPAQV
jgi:hypothetical protein